MGPLKLFAAADTVGAAGSTDPARILALVFAALLVLGIASIAIKVIWWTLKFVGSVAVFAATLAILTLLPLLFARGVATLWQEFVGTGHESSATHLDAPPRWHPDGDEDYGDSVFLDQSQP